MNMNKTNRIDRLIRILVILGLAIVGICLIICLGGSILILIKGAVGILAIVAIAAAVITIIERIQGHKEIKK
jgi:hypothetical protein